MENEMYLNSMKPDEQCVFLSILKSIKLTVIKCFLLAEISHLENFGKKNYQLTIDTPHE